MMLCRRHRVGVVTVRACSAPDVERKRSSLRSAFYSTQRHVTLQEVEMILKPLFQDVQLGIEVIQNKVYIKASNAKPLDDETNCAVLDVVNDWQQHDQLRRTLIRSLTTANKNGVYRYTPGVAWICPLEVYYVFDANGE
jgi:hypothetical protein